MVDIEIVKVFVVEVFVILFLLLLGFVVWLMLEEWKVVGVEKFLVE